MMTRIACTLSLLAFVATLVSGSLVAGHPLTTAIPRALVAMAGMFAIGLVVGWMAKKLIEESLQKEVERLDTERQDVLAKASERIREEEDAITVG
jgi:hypothetical protein